MQRSFDASRSIVSGLSISKKHLSRLTISSFLAVFAVVVVVAAAAVVAVIVVVVLGTCSLNRRVN